MVVQMDESQAQSMGQNSGTSESVDISPSSHRLYFTIDEFSEVTGLSPATIRRNIRKKNLPHFQPGGRGTRILIPVSALGNSSPSKPSLASAQWANVPEITGPTESSPADPDEQVVRSTRRGRQPKWQVS